MNDLKELLDEMFPQSSEGWPSFSEACDTFWSQVDESLGSSLSGDIVEVRSSGNKSDSLDSQLAHLRKNPKWRAFEAEVTRAYFSSPYFTTRFRAPVL